MVVVCVLVHLTRPVTGKYQTTVPLAIRNALNLFKLVRFRFEIRDEEVVLKCATSDADPAMAPFLAFLERDIAAGNATPVEDALMPEFDVLTECVAADLDENLDPSNE